MISLFVTAKDESVNQDAAGDAVYENSSVMNASSADSDSKGQFFPPPVDHVANDTNSAAEPESCQLVNKSAFSRGVSASGATLDLTRKSGLFKKKQTTSDVMKWTKVINFFHSHSVKKRQYDWAEN